MSKKRIIAILLSAMLCSLVVFSVFFIAAENTHDCSGDNCPICYQINMCESTVKSISAGPVAVAMLAAFVVVLLSLSLSEQEASVSETLVSLKVKLSI